MGYRLDLSRHHQSALRALVLYRTRKSDLCARFKSISEVEFLSWDQHFFDPIILPGRKPLVTLRDAAQFIIKLPKAERDADEWQAALQALVLVAEQDGPTTFARIGVMRALNRHVERVFDSSRKDHHWGKRKLARDRE